MVFEAMSKSKTFVGRKPSGELGGIQKFGEDIHRELLAAAEDLAVKAEYEAAINVAMNKTEIHCELVEDLIWVEIDNEEMYIRVNALIEPRLRRQSDSAG